MENTAFILDWTCKRCQDGLTTEIFDLFQNIPVFIPKSFLSSLTPLSYCLFGGTKRIGFLKATFKNPETVGVSVCRVFYITAGLPMSELWCTGSMALREGTDSLRLLGWLLKNV